MCTEAFVDEWPCHIGIAAIILVQASKKELRKILLTLYDSENAVFTYIHLSVSAY